LTIARQFASCSAARVLSNDMEATRIDAQRRSRATMSRDEYPQCEIRARWFLVREIRNEPSQRRETRGDAFLDEHLHPSRRVPSLKSYRGAKLRFSKTVGRANQSQARSSQSHLLHSTRVKCDVQSSEKKNIDCGARKFWYPCAKGKIVKIIFY